MPDAVTGDWSRTVEETPQGFLAGSYENTNQHLFGKEQRAASKRAYYACITQIDYALGRIFGCLRENDLFKNTWIIFTARCWETTICPRRICSLKAALMYRF